MQVGLVKVKNPAAVDQDRDGLGVKFNEAKNSHDSTHKKDSF